MQKELKIDLGRFAYDSVFGGFFPGDELISVLSEKELRYFCRCCSVLAEKRGKMLDESVMSPRLSMADVELILMGVQNV